MNILVDANVLLRLADPTSSSRAVARTAVSRLRAQGDALHIVPQCVYEFWAVATRPIAQNGLGLSCVECLQEVVNLKALFSFLDDKPTLFAEWEAVVAAVACHGKISHDARYVAAMRTHGLTHLLTFNVSDFTRFSGIALLDPNRVAAPGAGSPGP